MRSTAQLALAGLLSSVASGVVALTAFAQDEKGELAVAEPKAEIADTFDYPCDGYTKGLRGKGNFGAFIDKASSKSPFAGSYHLAEDIWVAGGVSVRSVASGKVVYSDFSPTWTDDAGHVHWNLGNVIVIEHELPPQEGACEWLCSVYVHLGADRRVKTGDVVKRGDVIGTIGKDRSEENGRYPAHLHFGLHRGPYLQISPGWKRELESQAREFGLPCGSEGKLVKGEIALKLLPNATVEVDFVGQEHKTWYSLLTGSTAPGDKPADIAGWCQGYGDKAMVEEWLRPSQFIEAHRPVRATTK